MGETFSQLGSREEENKSILPPGPAMGGKAACYSSTRSSKSFCSRMPCEGAASASYVTCPTCQGSGEIPQGEWPKALEKAWNPEKALGSQQAPLSLLEWSWVSPLLVPQLQAGQRDVHLPCAYCRDTPTPSALVVLPSPGGLQPPYPLSSTVP